MLNNLLALFLLLVFPALNLWRSLRPKKDRPPRPLLRRYWTMSWHSLALLGLLWVGAWQAGYTPRQLGFDLPLSRAGAWGLAGAVLLLAGLVVAGKLIERRKTPQARAEDERKMLNASMPWPRNRAEALAFGASMLVMTAGWEVLYRGFLLLLLTPLTGLPLAVIASALAYGIGHGYTSPKQLAASVISAFIFTIAYAWTQSLWWLILIHIGLPLSVVPAVIRAHGRREAANAREGQLGSPAGA
ncbi:CPBP family intramembrane metalloprotease [Massilia sp. UMI-21]|nr:CPBP family intramembrane metalloprotease [Massilia sp. UMI-21]